MSLTRMVRYRPAITLVIGLFVLGLANLAASAQTKTAAASNATRKSEPAITLATKPSPPAVGETTLTVTAKDAGGKPITGADVSVEFLMPAMGPMPAMTNKVVLKPAADPKLAAEGTYVGKGQVMMPGTWTVAVDVKVGGKRVAQKKLTMTAK